MAIDAGSLVARKSQSLSRTFDRAAVGADNAVDGSMEPGILLIAGRVRRFDVGVDDLR
jgi:hypothetical protein